MLILYNCYPYRNPKEDYMKNFSKENKLCDFSSRLTGMKFKDAKKDWINDKIYKYTANVVTKAISFFLELTIDLKVLIQQIFKILFIQYGINLFNLLLFIIYIG